MKAISTSKGGKDGVLEMRNAGTNFFTALVEQAREKLKNGQKQAEVLSGFCNGLRLVVYAKKGHCDPPGIGRMVWVFRYRCPRSRRMQSMTLADAAVTGFAELMELAGIVRRKLENGVNPNSVRLTVDELFELRMRADLKRGKRSVKDDVCRYNKHLKSEIGGIALRDIGRRTVDGCIKNLPAHLSEGSVYQLRALVKGLFSYAEREELIERSPARHLRLQQPQNQCKTVLSDVEMEGFFEVLETADERLQLLIVIILNTGCRVSEVLNARHPDVDFELCVLNLRDTKTGRDQRVVLPPMAMLAIQRLVELRKNDFLFSGRGDGSWTRPGKLLQRVVDEAGLERVSFHTFRRQFATKASEAGVDVLDLKAMLRHRSISMTARYVVQSTSHLKRQSGKAVAALIPPQYQN